MARQAIALGTTAKDGTGTDIRAGGDIINDNFIEVYNQANRMLDINSFVVSDTDDLYAHESQILIHKLGNKTVLLVMYCQDKASANERELTAKSVLRVYELTTHTLLKSLDIFYPGLVADITQPAAEPMTAPRMYITGDTLMCFVGVASGLYHRTIDMSNDDPSTWAASNLSIFQMTMKDSGGNDVKVNCSAANFQAHLEYTLGDTNAGYNNLAPFFRNLDRITVSGSNWYTTLELSDELGAALSNIGVLLKSTDSGANWSFVSLIGYTTSNRLKVLEPSLVILGTTLHVIARSNTAAISHFSSADSGATWSAKTDLVLSTIATKPTAINYYNLAGVVNAVIAVNLTSEVTGNTWRTTLGIYETSDFVSFLEIGKIVTPSYAHYPSLCHFSRSLYMSYSKGMKFNTDGLGATYYERNAIVVTRIY